MANNMSVVSIAMGTYNGAKFLSDQLMSISMQTCLPKELVISDDCSADGTMNVIRAFSSKAPFPVIIRRNEARLGYRQNFMLAASLCTGDLVAFCDQDDVWENSKIETVLHAFSSKNTQLVHHNFWIADDNAKARRVFYRADQSKESVKARANPAWFFPLGFSMVFRRELLMFNDLRATVVDPSDGISEFAHDQWIYFLASLMGQTVYIDNLLARYRQHDSNAYGTPLARFEGKFKISYVREQFSKNLFVLNNRIEAADSIIMVIDALLKRQEFIERFMHNEEVREAVSRYTETYRRVSSLLKARSSIYGVGSRRLRFKLFKEAFQKGAYRPLSGQILYDCVACLLPSATKNSSFR